MAVVCQPLQQRSGESKATHRCQHWGPRAHGGHPAVLGGGCGSRVLENSLPRALPLAALPILLASPLDTQSPARAPPTSCSPQICPLGALTAPPHLTASAGSFVPARETCLRARAWLKNSLMAAEMVFTLLKETGTARHHRPPGTGHPRGTTLPSPSPRGLTCGSTRFWRDPDGQGCRGTRGPGLRRAAREGTRAVSRRTRTARGRAVG